MGDWSFIGFDALVFIIVLVGLAARFVATSPLRAAAAWGSYSRGPRIPRREATGKRVCAVPQKAAGSHLDIGARAGGRVKIKGPPEALPGAAEFGTVREASRECSTCYIAIF